MKSAFYETEITAPLGCDIPGYYSHRYSDGVKDRLYAKAIAVEHDNETVVIVSIDMLKTTEAIHQAITGRVFEMTGVKPKNILICATHTHTGGPIKDFESGKFDTEYLTYVSKKAADCGVIAVQKLEDAEVKYACGSVDSVSFIRNYRMKDGKIRTNPGRFNPDIVEPVGEIDPDLPVLFFTNKTGEPLGAVISFSNHLDSIAGRKYSGDYPGVLSGELKKKYGHGFVSVFLTGACGNINHVDVHSEIDAHGEYYIYEGKLLATEAINALEKAKPMNVLKVASAKDLIKIDKRQVPEEMLEDARYLIENVKYDKTKANIGYPEREMTKRVLAPTLLRHAERPDKIDVYIQVIRIGDCAIYGLCSEVYVEYQRKIKLNSPFSINICATFANGSECGYIPTKEAIEAGTLYEANVPSMVLIPDAGNIIVEKALDLAKKL